MLAMSCIWMKPWLTQAILSFEPKNACIYSYMPEMGEEGEGSSKRKELENAEKSKGKEKKREGNE